MTTNPQGACMASNNVASKIPCRDGRQYGPHVSPSEIPACLCIPLSGRNLVWLCFKTLRACVGMLDLSQSGWSVQSFQYVYDVHVDLLPVVNFNCRCRKRRNRLVLLKAVKHRILPGLPPQVAAAGVLVKLPFCWAWIARNH